MESRLIIPGWGRPRKEIKRFPEGSYAIKVETTYHLNNRWIEKRKRPLYHVVQIRGFMDMDGVMGYSGLHTRKISTHYKKEKALETAERLNEERYKPYLEEMRRRKREKIEVEPNEGFKLEQFFK